MRKGFWLALIILPFLAIGLACGGGDDDSSNSDNGGSSNGGGGAVATSPVSGGGSSDSASPAAGGGGDNGGSSSDSASLDDCKELSDLLLSAASAVGGAPGAGASSDDSIEYTADYFQALADKSPPEIKDDMQVFADGFAQYLQALKDLGVDLNNPSSFQSLSQADLQKFAAAVEPLDSEEFQQASDNIQAYFESKCN